MKHLQILIFIGALIIVSCTSNRENTLPLVDLNGNSIPVLKFKDVKDTITLSLSRLVHDVNFIKLETREDNKLAAGKWSVGNKYLIGFCYDLGIFQFSAQGKFIRKLAGIGNGPQEVTYPVWTISKDENQIIIYDFTKPKSLLCFDLNSGLLLKNIPLALEGQLKNLYFESDSLLICAPLLGTGEPAADYNVFWQNLAGKLIKGLPAIKSNGSLDNGDNLLYQAENSFHLRPVSGDTIYQIKDFKIKPSFIFDPQNNMISPESEVGRTTFSIISETPAFMIVGTFTVTERVAVNKNAFRSKGKSTNYYIDKIKNKAYIISSFYNDYLGEKQGPAILRNQTGDFRYFAVDAISLLKKINNITLNKDIKIINRDQFINLGLQLTENDNPVLFIGQLSEK
jgi:hypothetical protein